MWIIDRFEEGHAVIEADDITFSVPAEVLPKGAKEGDCLEIAIDEDATEERKIKIDGLMNKLFGDD